jgi:capsular exopolysaccharide synthesis family protein
MIGWRRRRGAPIPAVANESVAGEPAALDPSAAEPGVYEISPALVTLAQPPTPRATAFHNLAREVIDHHLRQGRRGLAVCGVAAGTGVSSTAANLAVALAQAGVLTLLIDANLRDPALDSIIRPGQATAGLQQLLRSERERPEVIHDEVLPNLSLIFAGGAAADADELLSGDRFREILRGCMRDYGCIIVDTAPANRSADARTVAIAIGYAVIVGRRNFSFIDDAGQLSRHLAQDGVTVVGSILTDA